MDMVYKIGSRLEGLEKKVGIEKIEQEEEEEQSNNNQSKSKMEESKSDIDIQQSGEMSSAQEAEEEQA